MVQRNAFCTCRSRRELSNAYLLVKFGFDTAENEPCKVCPLSVYRSPRFALFLARCRRKQEWAAARAEKRSGKAARLARLKAEAEQGTTEVRQCNCQKKDPQSADDASWKCCKTSSGPVLQFKHASWVQDIGRNAI